MSCNLGADDKGDVWQLAIKSLLASEHACKTLGILLWRMYLNWLLLHVRGTMDGSGSAASHIIQRSSGGRHWN